MYYIFPALLEGADYRNLTKDPILRDSDVAVLCVKTKSHIMFWATNFFSPELNFFISCFSVGPKNMCEGQRSVKKLGRIGIEFVLQFL